LEESGKKSVWFPDYIKQDKIKKFIP